MAKKTFRAITTVDGDPVVSKHATFGAAISELRDDLYMQQYLTSTIIAWLRRGERVAVGDEGLTVEVRGPKPRPRR